MKTKFNVGDKVWFESTWSGVVSGVITEIRSEKDRKTDKPVLWVMVESDELGNTGARLENCYASEDECLAAAEAESKALIKSYKESIKDINDLVSFMYNNTVSTAEEYTNWEARTAVKERVKELLNIDL